MKRAATPNSKTNENLHLQDLSELNVSNYSWSKKSKFSYLREFILILLLGLLFFLSFDLFAQNSKGLFNLKEGDWFEVQVKEDLGTSKYLHLLSYQLVKQFNNGNQQYHITLQREKRINTSMNGDGVNTCYFGYDSYYPPFIDNKKTIDKKNKYTIEVSPLGNIISVIPDMDNSSIIILAQISPKKRHNYNSTSENKFDDSFFITDFSKTLFLPLTKRYFKTSAQLFIRNISETPSVDIMHAEVVSNDSTKITVPFIKRTGVPLLILLKSTQYILTAASFPIPGNTIVKGKIQNSSMPQSIAIENRSDYTISNDGNFYCSVFLTQPSILHIGIGNKNIKAFMIPGDTLDIIVNGNEPNQTIKYSGSAAGNTMLTNDIFALIPQYSWHRKSDSAFDTYFTFRDKQSKAMDELLKKYEEKTSEICRDYIRTELIYYFAQSKFEFCENNIYGEFKDASLSQLSRYPSDFFLETDTLPVMLNQFEKATYFNQFLSKSNFFKLIRISMSVGSKNTSDFNGQYSIAKASLDGYPLYSQTYSLLNNELKEYGYSSLQRIEPYYQDFINNCNDPAMVEPLKETYKNTLLCAHGKKFPLKSIVLSDGTSFSLEKYKGKPICLYFCTGAPGFDRYVKEIQTFKATDVEFIFAVVQNDYNKSIFGKSLIASMPNVKIEYIEKQDFEYLLPLGGLGRIFVLDKWFRIVDDNAENPITHGGSSGLEETLRKAIEAKRYSKAEKTAMLTIAGWSFGSVLFTFLIGWWFYRIRIRRIKKQEAVKRRIKELEIKAIRSQMNPHFIFNALNSIQSLINGNQFKEANIYLAKFAVLLRGVLNNSEKSRISLSDELQAVELYCQLEQLRFEFRFEIDIDPEVNSELIEIPGMIIQPLAENAVVHGLSAKGNQGELSIQVKRQNGLLCVCVSDNGVGLTTEKIDTLSQKGFGLKLVEERINILNLDGKEARLTVENRQDSAGTLATLTIPID